MATDIGGLKEQAQNLTACLERLRNNMDKFPSMKEARWLESMMQSSLIALDHHIKELERLGFRDTMPNTLYKRKGSRKDQ